MYEALRKGADVDELHRRTHIKHYFINQMRELVALEEEILKHKGGMPPDALLVQAKKDADDLVDSICLSVESAVAGRYFSAAGIAEALSSSGVADRVDHRVLIIPGLAARLSGEAAEATGWRVLVGPKDSSGLPAFIKERWPPGPA